MADRRSAWFKSSYSAQNGECVEVRLDVERMAVRDSKREDGPRLAFSPDAWSAFVAGAKRGR